MSTERPIAVLDSGLGGLSIWRQLKLQIPGENIYYLADQEFVPYGSRSNKFIRDRVSKLIGTLLKYKIKLAVIACNTATVAGIDYYRSIYPDLPIIGVVPVVKKAAALTRSGHFAIYSTTRTARSKYQNELIQKFASNLKVYNLESRDLVRIIENGNNSYKVVEILRNEIGQLTQTHADVLALGCTHFPFVKNQIRKIFNRKIIILDSAKAVAKQTNRVLVNNNIKNQSEIGSYYFYTTGNSQKSSVIASKLLKTAIVFNHIRL